MSQSPSSNSVVDDFKASVNRVVEELAGSLEQPEFNYGVVAVDSYADLLTERFGDPLIPDSVLSGALEAGRLIVHAPAGAGKTHLFVRLMEAALKRGIPVLIDLKNWGSRMFDEWPNLAGNRIRQADFLLRQLATPSVDEAFLAGMRTTAPRFLFVDGLNEVPRGIAQDILGALESLAQRRPNFAILVADRLARRTLPSGDWLIRSVAPMTREEVADLLQIPDTEVAEHMRRPFFVEMAMERGATGQASLIASYLTEHVALDESAIDICSVAAFYAYVESQSRSFSLTEFAAMTGPEAAARLVDSGVLFEASDDNYYFRHHLFHDYLAARFLVSHREYWRHPVLSRLTFNAASFDVLSLALELVKSTEDSNFFIQLIYDWNPYAPAYAIAKSSAGVKVSADMRFALAAMLAERRWDRIEDTRIKSEDALLLLTSRTSVDVFIAAKDLGQVLSVVREYSPSDPMFAEWRNVFVGGLDDRPQELIDELSQPESLLGWTAANVIRRLKLDDNLQSELRRLTSHTSEAVRWRAVHALGAQPSAENARLLLALFRAEEDFFVQYGVVRALVEIAAAEANLRDEISIGLLELLDDLASRHLLGELESSLVQTPAPDGWIEFAEPLVEHLWIHSPSIETQDRWRRLGYRIQSAIEAAT